MSLSESNKAKVIISILQLDHFRVLQRIKCWFLIMKRIKIANFNWTSKDLMKILNLQTIVKVSNNISSIRGNINLVKMKMETSVDWVYFRIRKGIEYQSLEDRPMWTLKTMDLLIILTAVKDTQMKAVWMNMSDRCQQQRSFIKTSRKMALSYYLIRSKWKKQWS